VCLSGLEDCVLADAVEGILDIKFSKNFFAVPLGHGKTSGMDCSFTAPGSAYRNLGGLE